MSVKDRVRQVEDLKAVPNLTKFGAGEPGFEKSKGVPLTEFEGLKWTAKLTEEWLVTEARGGQSQSGKGHWFKIVLECYTPCSDAHGEGTEVFFWFPYESFDADGWEGDKAIESLKYLWDFLIGLGLTTEDDLDDAEYEGSLEKTEEPFNKLNGMVLSGSVFVKMSRNKQDETKIYGPKVSLGYMVKSDLEAPPVPF